MFVVDLENIIINRNGVTKKEQRNRLDLCHEDDEAVKFAPTPDQSGPAPTGSDPVTQFGHRMSGHCSKYCSSLQLVKDNARPGDDTIDTNKTTSRERVQSLTF